VRLGQSADCAEHLLHGSGLTEDLGTDFGDFYDFILTEALFHGATDEVHRVIHIKGLGQILEGAALERGDGSRSECRSPMPERRLVAP
jgi:hypothetical protein